MQHHAEPRPTADTEEIVDAEIIAFPAPVPAVDEVADEAVVDAEIIDEADQAAPLSGVIVHRPEPGIALAPAARAALDRTRATLARPDRIALTVLKHQLVYGTVGVARGTGHLWRWVTAAELDQHLATNPKLVLDTRRTRRYVALGGVGTTAAAGTAAWIMLTPALPILVLALVLAVAGAVERTRTAGERADSGRAALGPTPGAKAVRRALADAKIGKRPEDIRIIGPVTRTAGAWEATAELPSGVTYKAAAKRRGEIAAAIGVDEVQVALDPVKGHNGRMKLWVADEDPMQGERVENPLGTARDTRFDFWADSVFLGRDARGRAVTTSLVERSYLIGGEPGGGKSVASNNILAAVALDPTVRIYLADGKFGFDLALYERLAEHVVTTPGHDPMMDMLDVVRAEMARRYALLRKIGSTKVTKQIAEKHGMPPILLHIDEIQTWSASGDAKADKAFVVAIADIVGRGRAAGIVTGAVTQRPAAEVVPTRLRDILSIRWALRCTTPDASDTILGAGRAAQGFSAAIFNADQRGAGYVLAEGAAPVQTRSAFMTEAEVARVTQRAHELRAEAGTLPATADRPEIRLLTAMLDAMTHPRGAHTADLLPALTAPEFAEWDAARLAAALRPLGVEPTQLAIDGKNRNGYRRADLQSALDRV